MNDADRARGSHLGRDWRIPAARILDAISLILTILLLSTAIFGGLRLYLGSVRLSITSPLAVLTGLIGVLIARHLLLRRPTALDRLAEAAKTMREGLRGHVAGIVTPVWLATRLGVLLVGVAAVATIEAPRPDAQIVVSSNPLVNLVARWDTGWYLTVATEGYYWDRNWRGQQNVAFFPGLPLLMRVGGAVLGARTTAATHTPDRLDRLRTRNLVAGWILALAASYAALWALYRWACAVAGRRVAAAAVALLSAYPFAIYYSVIYTEPFFLLGVIAAFNAMRVQSLPAAWGWGLFTGLMRPNGFLVALPLFVLAVQQRPLQWRLCAAAIAPVLGMLMFSGYLMSLTGRPLVWMEAHAAWGRTGLTWQSAVARPLEQVTTDGALQYALAAPYQVLNGAALLFALALLPLVWRRLGAAPALLVVVTLVPPLLGGGLMSMGRLTSTLFPVFVALASVIPRRHVWAWVAAFAVGQGLAAALFFSWRPLV